MDHTTATDDDSIGTTPTRRSTPRGADVDIDALADRLDRDAAQFPSDLKRLGIDGANEVHYHSPTAGWVWVVAEFRGEVTHEADLSGRSVWAFVEHVRGERGAWTGLNYDRSLGEGLARALQRGQEAER